jgi:hypothetical protein
LALPVCGLKSVYFMQHFHVQVARGFMPCTRLVLHLPDFWVTLPFPHSSKHAFVCTCVFTHTHTCTHMHAYMATPECAHTRARAHNDLDSCFIEKMAACSLHLPHPQERVCPPFLHLFIVDMGTSPCLLGPISSPPPVVVLSHIMRCLLHCLLLSLSSSY